MSSTLLPSEVWDLLDGSRMPDPGLILDGVKDFVDGEPEQSELLYQLVAQSRLKRESGVLVSCR